MGAISGKTCNAIGKTQNGWASRIHVVTDQYGRPIRIKIAEGQRNDNLFAKILLSGKKAKYVAADIAYDTNDIREFLRKRGEKAAIPSHSHRKPPLFYRKAIYKKRYIIEVFFQKIKSFRRIATRYEKTLLSYKAMVVIICILVWIM